MTQRIVIKRGDIVDIDLSGAVGSETMNDQTIGSRPCVVVQNDRGNDVSPLTQVIPLTDARQFKALPVQVLLNAAELLMPDSKESSAECGQIRTIDRRRIIRLRGEMATEAMVRIDAALRRSLSI